MQEPVISYVWCWCLECDAKILVSIHHTIPTIIHNFLIPYSIKLSGGVSVSKYTTETQYDYAARRNLQMQSYRLHLQV